jgi:argininosuccinate lyase
VCIEKNIKLNELGLAEYKIISPKFEIDLFKLLTSRSSVQNKRTKGSTSPAEVQKQILFWKKKLIVNFKSK